MKTDVLIAGCGCAGLYCALQLPDDKQIVILAKGEVTQSDSFLAQGGICMLKDESDYDITGKEITGRLLEQAKGRHNITILEHCAMLDIVCRDNNCYGVVAHSKDSGLFIIEAKDTVFACGGIGGLYRHSTNYRQLTGDGVAVALLHGIAVEHINYVQIHPTTLYTEQEGERSFLI